jgi:hypothetical protein
MDRFLFTFILRFLNMQKVFFKICIYLLKICIYANKNWKKKIKISIIFYKKFKVYVVLEVIIYQLFLNWLRLTIHIYLCGVIISLNNQEFNLILLKNTKSKYFLIAFMKLKFIFLRKLIMNIIMKNKNTNLEWKIMVFTKD